MPQVVDVTRSVFSTAATAHLVAMPATVNVGDELVVGISCRIVPSTPAGWRLVSDHPDANNYRLLTYWKLAIGNEDGTTVDWVTGASHVMVAHVYRVTGGVGIPPFVVGSTSGNTTTPDPPSLTAPWGSAANLWLTFASVGEFGATASAFPTNYTGVTDKSGTSGHVSLASAYRELTAATENPGTFTIDATLKWASTTIVIPPPGNFHAAVITSADDGYGEGTLDIGSTVLVFGYLSSAPKAFMRFTGVSIPQGATILSAVLDVEASELGGTVTSIRVKVSGEDADNPTAPTDQTDLNSRSLTTAGVDWDPSAWTTGTHYSPPDLSAVIQEIVDRGGWASGNALTLHVRDDGTLSANTYMGAASFNHATRQEPRLTITYSTIVSGGAEATINVSTEGSGIVYSEGGSTAEVTVTASGAGVEVHEGGAEAVIEIITEGDGIEIEYAEEGSEAVVLVEALGGGASVLYAEQGSEAVVNVLASGGGSQIVEGGAEATVNVIASGAGTEMGPAMIIEKGSWLSYRKLN